jgi:hypothetical protein
VFVDGGNQVGPGFGGVLEADAVGGEEEGVADAFGELGAGADLAGQFAGGGLVGPVGLAYGDQAGDEGADEEERSGSQGDAEAAVDTQLAAGLFLRGV